MKKLFIAVAIAMAGAWGIFQANQNNNAQLSDLQMENVELLAQGENIQFGFCAHIVWGCKKSSAKGPLIGFGY